MKGIYRNPVGSHTENRLSVYDKSELAVSLRIRGRGAIQLHGADARLHGLSIHNDTAATQSDRHVVEVRLARVLGIPQVRPADGDEDIPAGVPQVGGEGEGRVVADTLHRNGVLVGQLCVEHEHCTW